MGKLGEIFVITKFFALAHFFVFFFRAGDRHFLKKNYCRIAHFFLSKSRIPLCVHITACEGGSAPSIPEKISYKKGQSYIKLMID